MNKDIRPTNDKEQRHGYWERYHFEGNLWYKSFFHNDKRVGYEEFYWYTDGKIRHKKYNI
jgi:antitoxin component YwqK of YwqJK toxin-antitoxin module